jgi:hypothetical protein
MIMAMRKKTLKEEPGSWKNAKKFVEEVRAKGGKASVESRHKSSLVWYELPDKKKHKK